MCGVLKLNENFETECIFSIHSYNTRGATRGDFSLLEKTQYNMEYVPFAIMA